MDQPRRRLSAVWFADIVGYTALSSHDEPAAMHLVTALRQRPEFRFQSLGAVELRGITTRVEIFDVLFGTRAALAQSAAAAPPASHVEPVAATRRRSPAVVLAALAVIGVGVLAAVMVPRYARRVESTAAAPNATSPVPAAAVEGRESAAPPLRQPDRNAATATKDPERAIVAPEAARGSAESSRGSAEPGRGAPMRGRPPARKITHQLSPALHDSVEQA